MKALITGASSGIGWSMALEFAKRGYSLVIVARRQDRLEKLAARVSTKYKIKSEIVVADLTTNEGIDKVVKYAPKVDVLVNNAGFGLKGHIFDMEIGRVRQMLMLNIESLTVLTYAFAHAWKKRDFGRIINISSIASLPKAMPSYSAYAASKAYVRRFTNSLRIDLELKKSGIKMHNVLPGLIRTEFYNEKNTETGADYRMTPSRQFAQHVVRRILDKNDHEVIYGALSLTLRIAVKLFSAKMLARILAARDRS